MNDLSPGVQSNTHYRCNGCGAIYDFPSATDFKRCSCGILSYEQIRVIHVCDFCSTRETPTWWKYPAEDFTYDVQFPGFPQGGSRGAWSACQRCRDLIEANDRRGLAEASLANEERLHPEFFPAHYHELFAVVRKQHDGFFEHRTGDAHIEEDPYATDD